jgi:phosphoglycerate dehydrogenase-like enzyme
MTKLLVDVPFDPATVRRLETLSGLRITAVPHQPVHSPPRELPVDVIGDAEIFICTVPPKNHAEMKSLRFLQLTSVGYAQLYGLDLPARGVRVANARGVYDTSIAEWNIAMIINLARDVRGMIRNQEQGLWAVSNPFANEIRDSVVGLWGYGGIGRETARVCKALGQTVHVYARGGITPRDDFYVVPGTGDVEGKLPDRVFTSGEELEFLAGLDYLVLAMPLTPSTQGIIGRRELQAMKKSAYLLNPARGPLVDEQALVEALREGWIAGAALDTHYYYPMPPEHPLWKFPSVIMTPHISGSDRGPHFLDRFLGLATHNIEAFLADRPLYNELTAEELNAK